MSTIKFNYKLFIYRYIIYEIGTKGYVLKEERLDPHFNYPEKEHSKFMVFMTRLDWVIDNGCSEEELPQELGYLSDYDIKTHKEELKTTGICQLLCTCKQFNSTIYHLVTVKKTNNFSKMKRYHLSRYGVFLSNLKNEFDSAEHVEYYMN